MREDTFSLASGGAMNLVAGVVRTVFGFVFALIVARELHSSGAGALYQVVAVFSILTIVCQLGSQTALVRMISRARALHRPETLRPTILVGALPSLAFACIAAVLLFLFAAKASTLLVRHGDRDRVADYLRLFSFFIPVATAENLFLAATKGFGTMRPAAVIDSIRPALKVALALLILPVSRSALPAAVTWLAPILVCMGLALIAVRLLLRSEVSPPPSSRRFAKPPPIRSLGLEFWRFALPQSFSGVLQVAVLWLDVVLLGVLKGSHEAGIYATLSRYVLAGTLALTAIATAIAPLVSSLLTLGERALAGNLFRVGTSWAAAASLPIYLVMAVFAPVLMKVFGTSFAGGGVPLTILSLAMIANIVSGPADIALLMGGKSGLILLDTSAGLAVNLTLNVLLIPPFGMIGAAIAWTASIIVLSALTVIQAHHFWQINPFGRGLLIISSSATISYGLLGLVMIDALGRSAITLALTCSVGTVLHGAVIWRFRHRLALATVHAAWRRQRRALAVDTA